MKNLYIIKEGSIKNYSTELYEEICTEETSDYWVVVLAENEEKALIVADKYDKNLLQYDNLCIDGETIGVVEDR